MTADKATFEFLGKKQEVLLKEWKGLRVYISHRGSDVGYFDTKTKGFVIPKKDTTSGLWLESMEAAVRTALNA